MIYRITETTEMGKLDSKVNIVHHLFELDDQGETWFAHSLEAALAFAKSFPLYANVPVLDVQGDHYAIEPDWQPMEQTVFGAFFQSDERVTHTRQTLKIVQVATVGETRPAAPLVAPVGCTPKYQ